MIGRAILTTRMPAEESIVAGALNLWSARPSSSASFTTRWTTRRLRFLECKGLRRPHRDLVRFQSHVLECLHMNTAMGPTPTTRQPFGLLTRTSQSHLFVVSSEHLSGPLSNNPRSYFEYHLRTHSLTHFCMESFDACLQSRVQRATTTYLLRPQDA
jgi:hypothetical protein